MFVLSASRSLRSLCMFPRIALYLIGVPLILGGSLFAQPTAPAPAPTSLAVVNGWPTLDGTTILTNFRLGSGETLPSFKLHYLTVGKPHTNAAGKIDNAILLLHGTGGSAHSLLNPLFSNELFGPGEPLDVTKYLLILPDDIGHGESSKPSDGLHAHFPQYDYDDMARSQRMMLDDMKIEQIGRAHV